MFAVEVVAFLELLKTVMMEIPVQTIIARMERVYTITIILLVMMAMPALVTIIAVKELVSQVVLRTAMIKTSVLTILAINTLVLV